MMIGLALSFVLGSCAKEEVEPKSVFVYSTLATPTSSESVTLKNNAGSSVDLSGWTLGDKNDPNAYSIPNGTTLTQGNTITFNASTMGFQINDSGETIYLKNSTGALIDTWMN
jgi:hypothetical protein